MKTATEWLFKKLWETPKNKLDWYAFLEISKRLEKSQIMQSLNDGKAMALGSMENKSLEQYYKETYDE